MVEFALGILSLINKTKKLKCNHKIVKKSNNLHATFKNLFL